MNVGVKESSDAQQRWALLMDETVAEVFTAMLGVDCVPSHSADAAPPRISASIEFSGAIGGACTVTLGDRDARRIAEILAGGADDALAADTVGELCNVLAGGWKRRLDPPASAAGLSVPAIARDEETSPAGVRQAYDCDGAQIVVRLGIERLEETPRAI